MNSYATHPSQHEKPQWQCQSATDFPTVPIYDSSSTCLIRFANRVQSAAGAENSSSATSSTQIPSLVCAAVADRTRALYKKSCATCAPPRYRHSTTLTPMHVLFARIAYTMNTRPNPRRHASCMAQAYSRVDFGRYILYVNDASPRGCFSCPACRKRADDGARGRKQGNLRTQRCIQVLRK